MNADGIRHEARRTYGTVRRSGTLEWLTRIGLASKGIVYLLIGGLALMAALHEGGETTDQHGVIQRIAGKPFGEFALVIVGVGLLGYAAWRLACAIADADHKGSDAKGMVLRAGQFASFVIYTGLAFTALKIVAGSGGGGGDPTQTWSARLLGAPGGVLLLILAGAALITAAVYHVNLGLKEKFRETLRTHEMSSDEVRWATRAGKWGYVARGIVFGIVGLFVITAAVRANPGEARGLEGALDTLAAQPFGPWLLAFVAAGLACYGVYSLVEARYRRIHF
jgi:hypothetical protein